MSDRVNKQTIDICEFLQDIIKTSSIFTLVSNLDDPNLAYYDWFVVILYI